MLVDNEVNTDDKKTNCMTMVSLDDEEGIIFYGPNVHAGQHDIYKFLKAIGTTCVCWDNNCERGYPKLVDAQR